MEDVKKTKISKDLNSKKILVTRLFEAPIEHVWNAWTESDLLDEWWAPKPWKTKTKKMNFREGGEWLYAMIGPDGTTMWAKMEFIAISKHKSFEVIDSFCDENGKKNLDFPSTVWKNVFTAEGAGTRVDVEMTFSSVAAMEKIIEMGFEAGFTMAHANLDAYLSAQFQLRSQLKLTSLPRVTTYLNFPGNTEEAFNFYKSVFGTEFSGKGIQRFGDIPADSNHPPIADNIKKMVLHVELPILGNHILMATDAPKEMGFTVTQGNNMHISLEPTTKSETKKLFEALSHDGTISMPLADMFFGSYFGSCTDKFGINWMFNCIEK